MKKHQDAWSSVFELSSIIVHKDSMEMFEEGAKTLQELVDKVESLGESYQEIEAFITMCLCEGHISDFPNLESALNNFREFVSGDWRD